MLNTGKRMEAQVIWLCCQSDLRDLFHQVKETTLTYASRTVSGPGTYHCTVVAYNKALEPSRTVCSDGVTVDTTAPEIHEVSIENSWTRDGLVKDSTGSVWYIDRNRFRVPVDQPSESCR